MAPSRRFANYPGAQEAPPETLVYNHSVDKNPVLRGWPLAMAGSIAGRSGVVRRLLWHNAGFGQIGSLPGVRDVPVRFHPTVIPLADSTDAPYTPQVDPASFPPAPADLPGRFYSAADYHALYQAGQLTPLQVVEALLPLIRRGPSSSPHALAWAGVDEEAVVAAARASTARWAAGAPRGLVDGVPFGVKADLDLRGFARTRGLRPDPAAPELSRPVERSAWFVRKMEEAGAIVLGQMNMHESGLDTNGSNSAYGTPINPFNQSYYPGGSSSGAGSAIGSGIVPMAFGSDAAGSSRIPPAFNGFYGLKLSHARVYAPDSTMNCLGIMGATAADLTVLYRIAAQPDPEDPTQAAFAPSVPPPPTTKKYIGVFREWLDVADAEVRERVQQAIEHLRARAGYEVVDIRLPYLREAGRAQGAVCMTEGVDAYQALTPGSSRWLWLLSPAMRLMVSVGLETPAAAYRDFGRLRQLLMRHLAHLFETCPGLLVVSPTAPVAGWPVTPGDEGGFADPNMTVRSIAYTFLANYAGCPAVSCPAGYVDAARGEGALPVGLMAMAAWGEEERLLAFAREAEAYLREGYPGGRRRPGAWVDVVGLAREKVLSAAAAATAE